MKNSKKPNIILIVLDTVRYDHLSCYGYQRRTTPYLDSLSEEGTLYGNTISPSMWTLPTHASLLTGLFPSGHGADSNNQKIGDFYPTLPAFLSQQDYETVGFAAAGWLSEVTGFTRGFHTYYGPKDLSQDNRRKRHHGFQPIWKRFFRKTHFSKQISETNDKKAQLINFYAKSWIKSKGKEKPFFMFINFFEAHSPYGAPQPFLTRFLNPEALSRTRSISQDQTDYYKGNFNLTSEDFQMLKDLYDGELAYVDHCVEELCEFLKKEDLLDRSIVLITADHGENLGEKNHFGHRYCLYNTLIKVPLIVRGPGFFPSGHIEPTMVQSLDIFPTVVNLLYPDMEDKVPLQGESLLPEKLPERKRKFAISEKLISGQALTGISLDHPRYRELLHSRHYAAIFHDGYKLIWVKDGENELYHLKNDPLEEKNLLNQMPAKGEQLFSLLQEWKMKNPSNPLGSYSLETDEKVDDAIIRQLRALGYLDGDH